MRLQLGRRELIRLVRHGCDLLDKQALGARQISNTRVANLLVRDLFHGAVRAAMEDGVEQAVFLDDELLFVDDDAVAVVVRLLGKNRLACCYELGNGAAQCEREPSDRLSDSASGTTLSS